ncbi:MAG: DUF4340 domain-containing protein [Deltaproteobacteria bacterium]|nr:DUF4340 domain-containing protein [Deltaproteobacteria bacterium]
MKVKKEYIILLIVIVALGAYLALRSRDRKLYELPDIAPVDTKQITRLEVAKGGKTVEFEKAGSDWRILPQNYPADPQKIKEMLAVAENLTLSELISESKNYERYGLDEKEGIVFKCWCKKEPCFQLTIGKTAGSYHHTFVKLPGDDDVYNAEGNFRDKFDQKAGEFREKTVLAFDKQAVGEIEIRADGFSETFKKVQAKTAGKDAAKDQDDDRKSGGGVEKWIGSDGIQAETDKMSSLISTLSDLKCESFLEGKTKDDLTEPVYTLVIKGAKSYTLNLFAEVKIGDETFVPGVSSENDYPFLLTKWRSDSIMKKPGELKQKPAQAE